MSHEQSNEINELAKALAAAQGEMESAKKKSINPHFRAKYADLAACWDVIRETLPVHGLSVVQTLGFADGRTIVTTQLMHASGQWVRGSCPIRPVKDDPQGMGSAITYGRRYGLAAMVGLTQDDDDGQAASAPREKKLERREEPRREHQNGRADISRTKLAEHRQREAKFDESGDLKAIVDVEPRKEPKFSLSPPKDKVGQEEKQLQPDEPRRVVTLKDAIELVPRIHARTPLEADDFASKSEWRGIPLDDAYGWQDAAIEKAREVGFDNLNDIDRTMALWAKTLKGKREKGKREKAKV